MNVPPELDSFVHDYKINVFELAWLTDEQINSFTSDFRYVAILLRRLRTKEVFPISNTKYQHAREIIDLFRVMSHNNREIREILEEIDDEKSKSGGTYMTEKEMDNMINRFEMRGEKRKAIEIAKNLFMNGVSLELISKSTNMTMDEVQEIVKDVPVMA